LFLDEEGDQTSIDTDTIILVESMTNKLSQKPKDYDFKLGDRVMILCDVTPSWSGKKLTFKDGGKGRNKGKVGVVVGTTPKYVYALLDGEAREIRKANHNVQSLSGEGIIATNNYNSYKISVSS
jgi:hypothetical protein